MESAIGLNPLGAQILKPIKTARDRTRFFKVAGPLPEKAVTVIETRTGAVENSDPR
jgi:hypothetical protein